jgi:hypothetical protein
MIHSSLFQSFIGVLSIVFCGSLQAQNKGKLFIIGGGHRSDVTL